MTTNIDIAKLTIADIVRVYSGKPGCGCGCRGTYSETKAQKTRILNTVSNLSEEYPIVESDGVLSIETPTRYYWIYLRGFGHESVVPSAALAK
jgi:hypothetical protein